jgi:hypothetical protein
VLSVTVTAERRCESCDRVLGLTARPDRRFCSATCRQRAYDGRRRAAREAIREEHFTAVEPSPAQLAELERVLERATSEVVLVGIVAKAAPTNWRAAAWLLSRRWPERWGSAGRPVDDEQPTPPAAPDEFAELDQLAAKRRAREYGPKPTKR